MKNVGQLKKIILYSLFTALPVFAHAGGGSPGGGHDIEAGFKAKTLLLISQIREMSPMQKAKLKFDPFALSARIAVPNAFKPLCADDTLAEQMKKINKMAYVSDPISGVVRLDCTHYNLAQWRTLFISQRPEDGPFFLHEALRLLNLDDDYTLSGSYIAAVMAAPNYQQRSMTQVMSNLLSEQNRNCYIALTDHEIEFVVNGQIQDSVKSSGGSGNPWASYGETDKPHTALIEAEHSYDGTTFDQDIPNIDRFKARVFSRSKDLGCF